jgi:hypothetical protein
LFELFFKVDYNFEKEHQLVVPRPDGCNVKELRLFFVVFLKCHCNVRRDFLLSVSASHCKKLRQDTAMKCKSVKKLVKRKTRCSDELSGF